MPQQHLDCQNIEAIPEMLGRERRSEFVKPVGSHRRWLWHRLWGGPV